MVKRRVTRKKKYNRRRYMGGGNTKNLRIAFLFSGRITSYEHTMRNLKMLQDKYNAKYFCSINKKYANDYVKTFFSTFNMTNEQYNIEETLVPDWLYKCKKEETSTYERTYSVFFHNKKAFDLLEQYQNKHNIIFDIIVLYRADIHTNELLNLTKPDDNTIYLVKGKGYKHEYGGVSGEMAVGNYTSMKKYCSLVDYLKEYCSKNIVELNHELMLGHHLKEQHLKISEFDYMFELHPSRKDKRPEYTEGNSDLYK